MTDRESVHPVDFHISLSNKFPFHASRYSAINCTDHMNFHLHPATLGGLVALWACLLPAAALAAPQAADPFEDIIRKTEPLTPAQEQKTFHLPPGFEIQLVASEPAIGKPMNMAFDEKG